MLEYIYKRSQPNKIPKILLPVLESLSVSCKEVTLCIPLDRSQSGMHADTYIICKSERAYVISGYVKSEIVKKKNKREFFINESDDFDYCEYENYTVEENVSSLFLSAKKKGSGEYKIVANASLTYRLELQSAAEYLNSLSQTGTFEPIPDSEEENLFCPKCGQRYADPTNKICTECMDRKKIVARTAELLKKYKFKI